MKGWKNVYELGPSLEKSTLTFLGTFSARGDIVQPMLIYPYVRVPADIVRSTPDEFMIGATESGWMKAETFFEFIANGFVPYQEEHEIQRPVVLFVDGHKIHLTMQVSQYCEDHERCMNQNLNATDLTAVCTTVRNLIKPSENSQNSISVNLDGARVFDVSVISTATENESSDSSILQDASTVPIMNLNDEDHISSSPTMSVTSAVDVTVSQDNPFFEPMCHFFKFSCVY